MQPAVFEPVPWSAHALVDSGEGQKLERYGEFLLARPDPQALWRRRADARAWQRADLAFVRESDRGGRWESARKAAPPEGWELSFDAARFLVRPTPFKHVGVFPEQAPNWRWMQARLAAAGSGARVLNLFAYTGVASLLARAAGAEVTHVDASRTTLAWARENAELSGLGEAGWRWVLDDALTFARREVRRGARALQRASRGVPRLVNILAHKALLLVYGEGGRGATRHHVRAAAVDTPAAGAQRSWWWPRLRAGRAGE